MQALQKVSDQIQKIKVTLNDGESIEYVFQPSSIIETEIREQNDSERSGAAKILQFFHNLKN